MKDTDGMFYYMMWKYIVFNGESLLKELNAYKNEVDKYEYLDDRFNQYEQDVNEVKRIIKELYNINLNDYLVEKPIEYNNTSTSKIEYIHNLIKFINDLDICPSKIEELNNPVEIKKDFNKVKPNNPKKKFITPRKKNYIRHKRMLLSGAMVCILLIGMSLGVVGNRIYYVVIEKNDNVIKFDNSYSVNEDEDNAYKRIYDELGIRPLKLDYKPDAMIYKSLELNTIINQGIMRYEFNNAKLLLIHSLSDGVFSEFNLLNGHIVDKVNIKVLNQDADIYEYIDEYDKSFYFTSITIKGNYYALGGSFDKESFIKIVENIIFYN